MQAEIDRRTQRLASCYERLGQLDDTTCVVVYADAVQRPGRHVLHHGVSPHVEAARGAPPRLRADRPAGLTTTSSRGAAGTGVASGLPFSTMYVDRTLAGPVPVFFAECTCPAGMKKDVTRLQGHGRLAFQLERHRSLEDVAELLAGVGVLGRARAGMNSPRTCTAS